MLTEQSRTFSGHCPYGGTPCYSFLFTISEWEYLRVFKEDSKYDYVEREYFRGFEEESKYDHVEREYLLAPMNYASVATRPITMHLEHRIKSNSPPLEATGGGSL